MRYTDTLPPIGEHLQETTHCLLKIDMTILSEFPHLAAHLKQNDKLCGSRAEDQFGAVGDKTALNLLTAMKELSNLRLTKLS